MNMNMNEKVKAIEKKLLMFLKKYTDNTQTKCQKKKT